MGRGHQPPAPATPIEAADRAHARHRIAVELIDEALSGPRRVRDLEDALLDLRGLLAGRAAEPANPFGRPAPVRCLGCPPGEDGRPGLVEHCTCWDHIVPSRDGQQ